MTDRAEFHAWVRWLRRNFPGARPVRVYLCKRRLIDGHHGLCTLYHDAGRATIQIADDQNAEQTLDTLLEEWAHYLRDHLPPMRGHDSDHDEIYGVIYARLKRSWHPEPKHGEEAD